MNVFHRLRTYVLKPFSVFLLSITILYGVSYGAIINNFSHVPAGMYYWGNGGYPIDIVGDLAYIRMGYNGHWQVFDKVSSTIPDHPSFLRVQYSFLGHLARIFHLDQLFVFYASRVFFSLFYLSVIYFLIRRIFSSPLERIIAILLSCFSTGILIPGIRNAFFLGAADDALVFSRTIVAAHHYMVGGACILLSLFFLSRVLDNPGEKKSFVLSVILGFITSLLFAPDTLIIFTSIPIVFVIKLILHRSHPKKILTTWIGILGPYVLLVSLPLLYLLLTPANWKGISSINMEKLNPFSLNLLEYFLAIGGIYLMALLSLPTIIKKGNTLLLFFGSWVLVHPLGEFIISDILGINRVRYFLTPYFVIFSILATIGIIRLGFVVEKITSKPRPFVCSIVVALILLISIPAYGYSRSQLRVCFTCEDTIAWYPKQELIQAIWWLRDNTKEQDIVLSEAMNGNLIPAFAGNRVYTSWWFRLYGITEYWDTYYLLKGFYDGTMSDEGANAFLKGNSIAYVLFGEREREFNPTRLKLDYSVLQEVMQFGTTRIYKVL